MRGPSDKLRGIDSYQANHSGFSGAALSEVHVLAVLVRCVNLVAAAQRGRCKVAWKRLINHDDKVDMDQYVVDQELSLCVAAARGGEGRHTNLISGHDQI